MDLNLSTKFEGYHRSNPHVYRVLVQLARNWKRVTGRDKIGIAALFERARWEIAITTNDPDYKLTNSYRAYYARLIMRQEPDLQGIFNLRPSVADNWIERGAA